MDAPGGRPLGRFGLSCSGCVCCSGACFLGGLPRPLLAGVGGISGPSFPEELGTSSSIASGWSSGDVGSIVDFAGVSGRPRPSKAWNSANTPFIPIWSQLPCYCAHELDLLMVSFSLHLSLCLYCEFERVAQITSPGGQILQSCPVHPVHLMASVGRAPCLEVHCTYQNKKN